MLKDTVRDPAGSGVQDIPVIPAPVRVQGASDHRLTPPPRRLRPRPSPTRRHVQIGASPLPAIPSLATGKARRRRKRRVHHLMQRASTSSLDSQGRIIAGGVYQCGGLLPVPTLGWGAHSSLLIPIRPTGNRPGAGRQPEGPRPACAASSRLCRPACPRSRGLPRSYRPAGGPCRDFGRPCLRV